MLVPITCITCGCPIGHVDDLYRQMSHELIQAQLRERGTAPTQAAVDTGLQIEMRPILEQLGIFNDCCRTHIVTARRFRDYY